MTVVTLIDEMQQIVGDTGKLYASDALCKRLILNHTLTTNNYVWTSYKVGSTEYSCNQDTYNTGYSIDIAIWDPTIDETSGTAYTINALGGSIIVDSGTEARSTINITGTPVDFGLVLADYCKYLATHKAKEISIAQGNASYSPQAVYQQLLDMCSVYVGVRGLCQL